MKPLRWRCALVSLAPAAAHAHSVVGVSDGLLSGLAHPVSGLDHIVAMVSVGLWGAQLGRPAIWVLPVTFPLVMAVGGFLALIGVALPGTEIGIAISAVLLGAMVMLAARPPLPLAAALVACFAIFHGYAHGAELPPGGDGLLYSLGFIVSTGALHLSGIALGRIHHWPWGRVALRVFGSAVVATGVVFFSRALP